MIELGHYKRALLIMGYLLKAQSATASTLSTQLGVPRTTVISAISSINEQWPDVHIEKAQQDYTLSSFPEWLSEAGLLKLLDAHLAEVEQQAALQDAQQVAENHELMRQNGFLAPRLSP
ncbi:MULTISPECIES: HTH domain-containing protein [Aeromonas]|uniref:HTH domain-containing protein n=1 Tax=Aeromonas caviae TaxID=648 RepID=A0AAJ5ZGX2_AERCA|nr:HTH domain-containing protein [Aeromonas caviae]RWT81242.1 hypothetical protein DN604_00285 [Aeromonas caviae]WFG00174.1 HTH domain-containing protein [Aeromonas caviae]WVM47892.1 HTH domain-containing protein [Aeromonas hydrophila]